MTEVSFLGVSAYPEGTMSDIATCRRCKVTRPVTDFSPNQPNCKPCRAEIERARRAAARGDSNVRELPKRKAAEAELDAVEWVRPMDHLGRGPHEAELEATLERLDLGEVDRAVVRLCRTLARSMDFCMGDPKDTALMAPKYLQALKALKATPDTATPAAEETATLRLASY